MFKMTGYGLLSLPSWIQDSVHKVTKNEVVEEVGLVNDPEA